MKSLILPRAVTACVIVFAAGRLTAAEVVHIEDVSDQDVVSQPFSLERAARLRIVCNGAGDGDSETLYAYGWILDARTRQVVWALGETQGGRARGARNITFDGGVDLPAGDYIGSFAAFGEWRRRMKIVRFLGRELFRFEIHDAGKKRGARDDSGWGLKIDIDDADADAVDRRLPDAGPPEDRAVVQLTGIGHGALMQQGFTVPQAMALTVYCVGEGDPDSDALSDAGWILDARTRKRVWALEPQDSKHAGGARKNRYARQTITLPAGNYIAFYVSDDSHAAGDWNAPPPYDPDYWGLTLWAASAAEAARVRPYDDARDRESLVALIRQRSDAWSSQGLTVTRASEVRVYALGEYTESSGFVDEGWIEDFKTRRRIWGMSADNTHFAGGGAKNRFADASVTLAPGDYVVYYRSDDSHAYDEWNAPPPSDPTNWGITVESRGRRGNDGAFRTFDPEKRSEEGQEFLVRLVRVGSDAHVRKRFHLDRAMTVRIVALGEGQDHDMYDLGWIENTSTGDTVWEMQLEDTRHGGGAHKNRVYEGDLRLERGDYEAHYRTDGSHAWGDWNAELPRDPHLWGITITSPSQQKR